METTKRIYAPHELQPSTPIHPGEILKDELEARGLSQRKFAQTIGVSYSVFNEVVNGKRPITTEYALKIEAATGINAEFWRGMQSDYDMQTARHASCPQSWKTSARLRRCFDKQANKSPSEGRFPLACPVFFLYRTHVTYKQSSLTFLSGSLHSRCKAPGAYGTYPKHSFHRPDHRYEPNGHHDGKYPL